MRSTYLTTARYGSTFTRGLAREAKRARGSGRHVRETHHKQVMTDRRQRRWYQYSLRTLLLFVLLVSIGMSWLGVKLHRAREQKEAVEAIRKAGGEVSYDYQSDYASAEPRVPKWARALLGDGFFFDVLQAGASGTKFGDDEAVYLRRLTNLEWLSLRATRITDAGLEHLEGLARLEELYLSRTNITDAGLEHLKRLTNLTWLNLSDTQVTDAGLEHLKGLTSLQWLDLSDTQVSDAGLEHLQGLSNLEDLDLSNTQVTDAGVKGLQRALPNCDIFADHLP